MPYLGGIKSDTVTPDTTGQVQSSAEKVAPTPVMGALTTPLSTQSVPGVPPCENCQLQNQVAGKVSCFSSF